MKIRNIDWFIFCRVIVHFKAKEKKGKEEKKLQWKLIETEVRKKYPKLKVVYSRADESAGDLAFSSHKLGTTLEGLCKDQIKAGEDTFTFERLEGEALRDFWQKHGGHY